MGQNESNAALSVWLKTGEVVGRLVQAMQDRGVQLSHYKAALGDQSKLQRIVTILLEDDVSEQELHARYAVVRDDVERERLWAVLRHAFTGDEKLRVMADFGDSVEAFRPLLNSMVPWKVAAICLYFGLGDAPPCKDTEQIARELRRSEKSVSVWLGSVTSAGSFARRMQSNSIIHRPSSHLPLADRDLSDQPIDVLGLPVYELNLLVGHANVHSVGQLVGLSAEDLRALSDCFVQRGIDRIESALKAHSLSLRS